MTMAPANSISHAKNDCPTTNNSRAWMMILVLGTMAPTTTILTQPAIHALGMLLLQTTILTQRTTILAHGTMAPANDDSHTTSNSRS